jgi:hypothetical protein
MTRSIGHGVFRGSLTAAVGILITLSMSFHTRAGISIGPTNSDATVAEQQRFFQFSQAEESFQAKIRVGQERYHQKQIMRAKIIAGMSSELRARQQAVVMQPVAAPDAEKDEPLGGFLPALALSALAGGFVGFRYFVKRQNAPRDSSQNEILYEAESPVSTRRLAEETFYCKGSGVEGRGLCTNEGFLVLKGSVGCKSTVPMRTELFDTGVMREESNAVVFQQDHLFPTPSMAAIALMGMKVNGWLEWKTEDGITLETMERLEPKE